MKRRAFTLVELLVVIAVIIILVSVSIPAVRSMMRDNSRAQAVNVIRAQLSAARTIAIAQHRQAGVIFFEETIQYAPSPNTGQTAMQLIVEDPNQLQHGINYTNNPGNTVFIYHSLERAYLPTGIQVAALNDNPQTSSSGDSSQILTGENVAGRSRVILFDANGHMITRNGIMRPALGAASTPPKYPYSYGDWFPLDSSGNRMGSPNDSASNGVSSPGLLVFSQKDYKDAGLTTAAARATWIQQHADVLVINAYTGNIINNK